MNAPGRLLAVPVVAVLLITVGCGPDARPEAVTSPPVSATRDDCAPPNEEAAVTDHWPVPPECELRPYPYVTPTPALEVTALDGVYERRVTGRIAGPAGKCTRCPPYRIERGETNLLMLDRGVFRVVHRPGEWRNVGHFEVDGATISFFNDPNCTATRGVYAWQLQGDTLTMRVVEDDCAFGGLRVRYLTATDWTRTDS